MRDSFYRFARRFERQASSPILLVVAGFLFLAGIVGFINSDDGGVAKKAVPSVVVNDSTTTSTTVSAKAVRTALPGFSNSKFRITKSSGEVRSFCGLIADNDQTRAKGLMGRTDLSGFDGMIFVFQDETDASFYMANVPAPISVAWFGTTGQFISSSEMDVCTSEAKDCPRYGAIKRYKYAIETFKGGINNIEAGTGSTLSIDNSTCV